MAEFLSKLSLSGLQWEEASSEIYQTVRTVVGTTRQKAKYWVYDHRERKAAGNTAQGKTVAKRKFAVLCDSWWDRRADQLQCVADAGDIKKVHQLLREICGPTRRKAICLPMPGWNRTTKAARREISPMPGDSVTLSATES